MTDKGQTPNHLAAAFLHQFNLIGLGFLMLLSLVLWNPVPLLIAMGLEIIFMAIVPGHPAFKRYVARRKLQQAKDAREERLKDRINSLSRGQQHMYHQACSLVDGIETNFQDEADSLGDVVVSQLDTLRERLLWLMELHNSYQAYLGSLQGGDIQRDIADVERQMQASSGRVKASLAERLDILQKRAGRFNKVYENRAVVSTQIMTVMDILRLLQESSLTMRNPQSITKQLDDLLLDVESTEEAVQELESMSGGRTLDDFDAELEKALATAPVAVAQSQRHRS